jgi:hypothetical protein
MGGNQGGAQGPDLVDRQFRGGMWIRHGCRVDGILASGDSGLGGEQLYVGVVAFSCRIHSTPTIRVECRVA